MKHERRWKLDKKVRASGFKKQSIGEMLGISKTQMSDILSGLRDPIPAKYITELSHILKCEPRSFLNKRDLVKYYYDTNMLHKLALIN